MMLAATTPMFSETIQTPIKAKAWEIPASPSVQQGAPGGATATLVVSLQSPNHVLMCDTGLSTLLEFTPEEACGRSIRFLNGPLTDGALMLSAIKGTSFLSTTSEHLTLYSRSGVSRNLFVSFSPFHDSAGGLLGCSISMEQSDAVTMKDALQETTDPKVLVSAERPHTAQMANAAFSDLFGFSQGELIGRPLEDIHGPSTDLSKCAALIQLACKGKRSTEIVSISSNSGIETKAEMTCVPVMEPLSSKIGSLLCYFSHCAPAYSETHQSPIASPFISEQLPWPSPSHSMQLGHGGIPHPMYSSMDDMHRMCPPSQQPSPTPRPRSVPTINPRRKACAASASDDAVPVPVTVTLDLLVGMSHLKLVAAAQRINVSATALKKACRKLGVDRWPYRGGALNVGGGRRAAPRDFDEAYVRKLHRKYGAARPSPSPAQSPQAAAAASASAAASGSESMSDSSEVSHGTSPATPPCPHEQLPPAPTIDLAVGPPPPAAEEFSAAGAWWHAPPRSEPAAGAGCASPGPGDDSEWAPAGTAGHTGPAGWGSAAAGGGSDSAWLVDLSFRMDPGLGLTDSDGGGGFGGGCGDAMDFGWAAGGAGDCDIDRIFDFDSEMP